MTGVGPFKKWSMTFPYSLQVYGYSMGFGRADHSKTVDALKTKYPNYKIDKSDDGY